MNGRKVILGAFAAVVFFAAAVGCSGQGVPEASPTSVTPSREKAEVRNAIDDEVLANLGRLRGIVEDYDEISTSCFFAANQSKMQKVMDLGVKSDINKQRIEGAVEEYDALDTWAPVREYENAASGIADVLERHEKLYEQLLEVCD